MTDVAGAAVALRRNVLALMSGLLLWTAGHFGVIAVLPLFLHDQGYDARSIGFMLGATGVAQLCVRPFGGWILDAFGRRVPLVLALVLLAGAAALLLAPTGWAVLANRVLTGAAFSIGTTAFYTLAVEVAPAGRGSEVQGYVALGITLGVGIGPPVLVGLYQGFLSEGALPSERLVTVAIGAVAAALVSGACFSATLSAFRPLGRAHPYALRANFRREGLLPAFLNFCAQVPNTGFSAFLPLWAIGRGVGNPGILFLGSQVGAVASRLLAGRLADRYGQRIVLVPAMVGVAATLIGMSLAAGLPVFLILAIGLRRALRRGLRGPPRPRRRGGAFRGPQRGHEHLWSRGGHGPAPGPLGTGPRRGRMGLRRRARRGRYGAATRRGGVPGAAAAGPARGPTHDPI